jgi:hypothetical protein
VKLKLLHNYDADGTCLLACLLAYSAASSAKPIVVMITNDELLCSVARGSPR